MERLFWWALGHLTKMCMVIQSDEREHVSCACQQTVLIYFKPHILFNRNKLNKQI